MKEINSIIKYSSIIILTMGIAFFLIEIILRIAMQLNPGAMILPDSTYMRYRGKPHFIEINGFQLNSKGYKDNEFSSRKREGIFRILAVGDSYTYGSVPYQQCYMTLMKEKLKRLCDDCELINMGIPSTAPIDYLSLLIHEGIDIEPDMVLVNMYFGDDFNKKGKRLKPYYYSCTISLINSLFVTVFPPSGRTMVSGAYDEMTSVQTEQSYIDYLARMEISQFKINDSLHAQTFDDTMDLIITMKKICDSKGIFFAVICIPTELQYRKNLQNAVLGYVRENREDYDFHLLNKKIAQKFNESKIPYFDLLINLENHYILHKFQFNKKNDTHWNIAGNRAGSEFVFPWLMDIINTSR